MAEILFTEGFLEDMAQVETTRIRGLILDKIELLETVPELDPPIYLHRS